MFDCPLHLIGAIRLHSWVGAIGIFSMTGSCPSFLLYISLPPPSTFALPTEAIIARHEQINDDFTAIRRDDHVLKEPSNPFTNSDSRLRSQEQEFINTLMCFFSSRTIIAKSHRRTWRTRPWKNVVTQWQGAIARDETVRVPVPDAATRPRPHIELNRNLKKYTPPRAPRIFVCIIVRNPATTFGIATYVILLDTIRSYARAGSSSSTLPHRP
ncbi:hypothetical protein ACRALDRAFT_213482 [Sodiomyces alcalophilus JCM 7366]|uniref:uncharacterized protein n=1 Tax=Sodiomyces alcalophilus JCM 7366 TaxID=591952 RepID=UPI0039B582FA